MKKTNTNTNTNTNTEIVTAIANELQMQFELRKNVSLRKVAQATSLNYQTMLRISKKPRVGVAYNPDELNFEAIAEYIVRAGDDKVAAFKELDWQALDTQSASGRTALLSKDINDPMFDVGKQVYLRTHPTTPYNIIYKTSTHIVIMLEGSEEPQAWSISTFFFKGPQVEPRAERVEVAQEEA